MKIVDLSFEIETDMPTCGTAWHQCVEIESMGTIESVGRNTHRILLGSHSGTHMDAPSHFIQRGRTVRDLDIANMVGPVTVIDFRNIGAGCQVSLEDVRSINVTSRMAFVFGWYHKWKTDQYYKEFPYFSTESIKYLINHGMKYMAMDTPSPDAGGAISNLRGEDSPNHKLLLKNEVIIVEYLNNTEELLDGKRYELISLPLKIRDSDGSPARVLAREVIS